MILVRIRYVKKIGVIGIGLEKNRDLVVFEFECFV